MAKKRATKTAEKPAEKPVSSYKGLRGVKGAKQKHAVDALEQMVRDALEVPDASISLDGVFRILIKHDGKPIPQWQIDTLTCTRSQEDGGLSKQWFCTENDDRAVISTAEDVLYAFGSKPVKSGKGTSATIIDLGAVTKSRFMAAIVMPAPSEMWEMLAVVEWLMRGHKDRTTMTAASMLVLRPYGFYGKMLGETLTPMVETMRPERLKSIKDRLWAAQKELPKPIFVLNFNGYTASDKSSHHLAKTVAAHPAVLAGWLKEHSLQTRLNEPPINLSELAKAPERYMREQVVQGKVDLVIDKDVDGVLQFSGKHHDDPVHAWCQEVVDFEIAKDQERDKEYMSTRVYSRVDEELEILGETIYKDRCVTASGHGYSAIDRAFDHLIDCMRAIDAQVDEINTVKVAKPEAPKPEPPKKKEAPKPVPEAPPPAPEPEPPPPEPEKVVKEEIPSKPPRKPRPKRKPKPKPTPPVAVEEPVPAQLPADPVPTPVPEAPKTNGMPQTQNTGWSTNGPVTLDEIQNRADIPWERVQQFFKGSGRLEPTQEEMAIRKHLMSDYQRDTLAEMGLSIGDILNGRYNGEEIEITVRDFISQWNSQLGFTYFSVP